MRGGEVRQFNIRFRCFRNLFACFRFSISARARECLVGVTGPSQFHGESWAGDGRGDEANGSSGGGGASGGGGDGGGGDDVTSARGRKRI